MHNISRFHLTYDNSQSGIFIQNHGQDSNPLDLTTLIHGSVIYLRKLQHSTLRSVLCCILTTWGAGKWRAAWGWTLVCNCMTALCAPQAGSCETNSQPTGPGGTASETSLATTCCLSLAKSWYTITNRDIQYNIWISFVYPWGDGWRGQI